MKIIRPLLLLCICGVVWAAENQGYTPDTEFLCSCGKIIRAEADEETFCFYCNLATWTVTCPYCGKEWRISRDYDYMIDGHGQLGIREREYWFPKTKWKWDKETYQYRQVNE